MTGTYIIWYVPAGGFWFPGGWCPCPGGPWGANPVPCGGFMTPPRRAPSSGSRQRQFNTVTNDPGLTTIGRLITIVTPSHQRLDAKVSGALGAVAVPITRVPRTGVARRHARGMAHLARHPRGDIPRRRRRSNRSRRASGSPRGCPIPHRVGNARASGEGRRE